MPDIETILERRDDHWAVEREAYRWTTLSARMLSEGEDVFLADRTTPELLRANFEAKRAVMLELNGVIIGYAALWTTESPQWVELGSLWVAPEFRGWRLSSLLYEERLKLVPEGVGYMTVTHQPRAAHLALAHGGMHEATGTDWFRDVPEDISCGPCDRVPEREKKSCPFRAVERECRLFVGRAR